MSIVKSVNKKTGITYVYESESYWDPEKKQPRNRRKLIGKLDENGEIVPTGKRGPKRAESVSATAAGKKEIEEAWEEVVIYKQKNIQAQREISELKMQIGKLEKEKENLLDSIGKIIAQYRK